MLVPVFWVVVFGLFWKRNSTVAVITLLTAWIVNTAWSFTPLPQAIGLSDTPNAYVTLAVTLLIGVAGNLLAPGKEGYFRSVEYRTRRAAALPTPA